MIAYVEMYADLACPFAYVAHARWRRVRDEYAGRLALATGVWRWNM